MFLGILHHLILLVISFEPSELERIPSSYYSWMHTGMSSLTQWLQRSLEVSVIDPAVPSLKLAEMYVNMGLTTGKTAREPPSEKKYFKKRRKERCQRCLN
jgi:hypothetical protein